MRVTGGTPEQRSLARALALRLGLRDAVVRFVPDLRPFTTHQGPARGHYNPDEGVCYVANDAPASTIAHELGHAWDYAHPGPGVRRWSATDVGSAWYDIARQERAFVSAYAATDPAEWVAETLRAILLEDRLDQGEGAGIYVLGRAAGLYASLCLAGNPAPLDRCGDPDCVCAGAQA